MKFDFKKNRGLMVSVVVIAIGLLVALSLVHPHLHQMANDQNAGTVPTVAVVKVARQDLFKQVTIPAEFRPYVEVALHAKVSGYVDQMNVDIGDKVKAGQLLATLVVPELHDELSNAVAVEQKAEADYTNVNLVYTRMLAVNTQHPNLVAEQDIDTAAANNQTAAAAIASSKAEVGRYKTMLDYTRITAPFDGVVTWRYADPGALIQAGTTSDSQSLPLVRVSDNYLLRLDFPVSVDNVQYMQVGDTVNGRIDSLGGKLFTGKITRYTDKVDEDTRTMMVEIEVPNKDLQIVPGMYATVILEIQKRTNALAIPTEAVTGDKNNSVLIINQDNKIEARTVTLGVETPDKYEVLSGLNEGETVMVGNPSHLQPGQKVETMDAGQGGGQ